MPARAKNERVVYSPLRGGDDDNDSEAFAPLSGSARSPEASSGCCGHLFIHWLWPLLRLGRRRKLEMSDMYPLMPEERSETISDVFVSGLAPRTYFTRALQPV
jgi:hypothetical protein